MHEHRHPPTRVTWQLDLTDDEGIARAMALRAQPIPGQTTHTCPARTVTSKLTRVALQHTNVRRSSLRRSDGEEAGLHATYTTTGLVLDRLIPPNGSSSPTSTSPYHGPRRALPQQHPINQAMTCGYAESGAS